MLCEFGATLGLAEDWATHNIRGLNVILKQQYKEDYDSYMLTVLSLLNQVKNLRDSKRTDFCGIGALQHDGCTYNDNHAHC